MKNYLLKIKLPRFITSRKKPPPREKIGFYLIILLGIIVRAYHINTLPPPLHIDEAFLAQSAIGILDKSLNLLDTRLSITVAGNSLTALFIHLWGVTPFTLRLQSIIFGTLTNILLYFLARDPAGLPLLLAAFHTPP
jgi:4-amino-4-deoxy-L-arabinose transferase-like glycosyltransferase